MHYYVGSQLLIEWTNQHSCGMENNNCQLILQFMCADYVRDGNTSTTIPVDPVASDATDANGNHLYGMHENYAYYSSCLTRQRNGGLFIADRNLNNGIGATATRQVRNILFLILQFA